VRGLPRGVDARGLEARHRPSGPGLPAGVEAVAAPAGVHAVDYVRSAYAARAAAA
jgi:hypothetical protein